MRNVCLCFQVHQPFRLKRFRFFDIGKSTSYFDDSANRSIVSRVANRCYVPTGRMLLKLIKRYKGDFRVAFSISGTVLDQLERFSPKALDMFRQLLDTGCVELLGEPYYHSLASVADGDELERQVLAHRQRVKALFGVEPTVFFNSEMIYSDAIGERVSALGFKAILAEGTDALLEEHSPLNVYRHPTSDSLSILLRSYRLSDDIAFRFSNREWEEWPLTAEKYATWLNAVPDGGCINLCMDYEAFGEHQRAATGVLDFLGLFPKVAMQTGSVRFVTPSDEVTMGCDGGVLSLPHATSWADSERDLSAWLGNVLQQNAFEKLYSFADDLRRLDDGLLYETWRRLQACDHFYYMSVKQGGDGVVHRYFNHFDSPYEAYIAYMNVLADFEMRISSALVRQKRYEGIRRRWHQSFLLLTNEIGWATSHQKIKHSKV